MMQIGDLTTNCNNFTMLRTFDLNNLSLLDTSQSVSVTGEWSPPSWDQGSVNAVLHCTNLCSTKAARSDVSVQWPTSRSSTMAAEKIENFEKYENKNKDKKSEPKHHGWSRIIENDGEWLATHLLGDEHSLLRGATTYYITTSHPNSHIIYSCWGMLL